MTANADDYLDSPLTTGKLAIGAAVNATFSPVVDTDWFAVTLVAGTEYMFGLTLPNGLQRYQYVWLDLLDANGKYLGVGVAGGSGLDPAINFRPGVSGTYYLAAGFENDTVAATAVNYAVSAAVRSGADDHPVGAAGAGALSASGTAAGVFEVAGDRDWFKFHADAGLHYTFFSTINIAPGAPAGAVAAGVLRIVDADGAILPSSIGATFDALASGDYYLDVSGLRAGSYNIISSARADDYPATDAGAGMLAPGTSAVGVTQYDGDIDRFAVVLAAGETYTFTLTAGLQDTPSLQLLGLDGARLNATYADHGRGAFDFLAAVSGTYHLDVSQSRIYTASGATGAYTLAVSAGRADEIGNTPATAAPLAVGAVAHAAIQGSGDLDVFKATLAAGVSYAFALASDGAGTAGLTLTFRAADGSVTEAAALDKLGYYTVTPASSGDYFAAVGTSAMLTASLPYALALSQPADDVGANPATAGQLAIGARVNGMLEAGGGDRDWFAVDLTAGTTYWFALNEQKSGFINSGQLRLLDASGALLAQAGPSNSGVVSDTLPYLAVQSGRYYVEVASPSRNTGAYTLSAAVGVRDDYGNTPASAGLLTPAAPVTGKFELATDKDMFRIDLVAGVYYGIDAVGPNNNNPQISIVDASGATIYTDFRPDTRTGVLFGARASGPAYVTLSSGYATSTYTLTETVFGPDDFSAGSNTAGTLVPGASLQASLSYPGDVDWVRVHLDSGVGYAFQLLAAASGGGSLGNGGYSASASFSLRDANGATVAAPLSGTVEPRLTYTPAKTGDYYLAAAYVATMGSYTLKAQQLSGDASGPSMLAQSRHSGDTGVSLVDTSFTLAFSEAITVDVAAITIKNSAGQTIALRYGGTVVNDNTLTFQAALNFKPDTYTVSIAHTAIHDLAGNAYTGAEAITFTTVLPVAVATSGNDLLLGGGGVRIDGGAGVDTVLYDSPNGNIFFVSRAGAALTVNNLVARTIDTLVNVERLLINGSASAYDVDGNGGQAYRLYQAAFHRTPDERGVGYWIAQMDKGLSLRDVAQQFVSSAEFSALYGAAPSDNAYITALYSNVLHRAPDAAGFDYWGAAMHNGGSRADVLQQFSESVENQAALLGAIQYGFSYTLY